MKATQTAAPEVSGADCLMFAGVGQCAVVSQSGTSGCLLVVREKAKGLLELLSSNDAIRSEREKARALRDKFVGIGSTTSGYGGYGGHSYGGSSGPSYSGRYGA